VPLYPYQIDGLDTLMLMDLPAPEMARARVHVSRLDFSANYGVSFFETFIRYRHGYQQGCSARVDLHKVFQLLRFVWLLFLLGVLGLLRLAQPASLLT